MCSVVQIPLTSEVEFLLTPEEALLFQSWVSILEVIHIAIRAYFLDEISDRCVRNLIKKVSGELKAYMTEPYIGPDSQQPRQYNST